MQSLSAPARRPLRLTAAAAAAVAFVSLSRPAAAQPLPEGFLCCNLRTDGRWITDINYDEAGKRLIPAGTPVRVTGYGRQRVFVTFGDGSSQAIGNDYSRDLDLPTFAARYVVPQDPRIALAAAPAAVRQAVDAARVARGMTREQVIAAVGYPVTSENPRLDAPIWRYWLTSFEEFQVSFGPDGRVSEVSALPTVRQRVAAD